MPLLRVKIILNEGGEGVPLSQLTDIADEAEKFLRYLAEDAGINVERGDWLARNFRNQSVRFDVERETTIPIEAAKEFNRKFEYVDAVMRQRRPLNGEIRHRTMVQYTKVAKALGPHEKLAFGLYRADDVTAKRPYKYAPLTKRDAEILSGFLSEEVTYRGSIHGHMHQLGVAELWFHLREAGSGELVRCDFREDVYRVVVEACERRNALIYVHGRITARRADRAVTRMRVDLIKAAPRLTEEQYLSFFGADPNYTGDMSSEDFIERNRYEH